jgi:hypothetical protein
MGITSFQLTRRVELRALNPCDHCLLLGSDVQELGYRHLLDPRNEVIPLQVHRISGQSQGFRTPHNTILEIRVSGGANGLQQVSEVR